MKSLYTILVFLILSGILLAQDPTDYYITFENDTIHFKPQIVGFGEPERPYFEKLVWQIKYRDKDNNRQYISPKVAKEVSFCFNGLRYKLISVNNTALLQSPANLSGKRYFAELKIEGRMKLLKYHGLVRFAFYQSNFKSYVLVKNENESLVWDLSCTKKELMEFFADCPMLAGMIENKDKSVRTPEQITTFFNNFCGDEKFQKELVETYLRLVFGIEAR
jgi:hypothetical protein